MNIELVRIDTHETEKLWKMQINAFKSLLEKYRDFETSPGAETKEKIEDKLLQDYTFFYYIYVDESITGAVRVVDKKDGSRKRVAPIFIMEQYRNKGIAQKVFSEIERIHGENNWKLDPNLKERVNWKMYEKLGLKREGDLEKINDKMDIVYYIKD